VPRWFGLAVGGGLWLCILAVTRTSSAESRPGIASLERAPLPPKRAIPDFDGLPSPSPFASELALWLPRTAALPLHATLEHLVRRPLGFLVSELERLRLPAKVHDALTWGPRRASSIVPTALIDFGFRPSVGLYLSSDDWLYDGSSLRLHLATGGRGWYRVSTSLRHHLVRDRQRGPTRTVELHAEAERRTDRLYWGIGPRAPHAARVRFAESVFDAHLSTIVRPWRKSRIDAYLGVRLAAFDDEHGEVQRAVGEGRVAPPSGFGSGYACARVGLRAILDTRTAPPLDRPNESDALEPSPSGVRFVTRTELVGGSLDGTDDRPMRREPIRFVRQGLKLGASLDLWRRRVVSTTFTLDFVQPIGMPSDSASVLPFTELVTLGGSRPLRGFLPGRLLDRSAVSITLEYAWPIWIWLDGVAHYGVGNVFGASLEGASLGELRQSFGLGMRTNVGAEYGFEMMVAAGTRPFDEGGTPESLRFVVGSQLDW
jgi:hypothetical protein